MSKKIRSPLAVVVCAVLIIGCGTPPAEPDPIRPVRAIKVGDLLAAKGREFPGRATAKAEVDLSLQVSGPLVSLPVDVGSTVKKGDTIAAIDPRDFETALASAQGNLERAKANLMAMERGARAEEIEQLKADLSQAEASLRQATAEHARTVKLMASDAASQSEFDITLARQERCVAEVKSAKEALNIGMSGAREEDLEAKRSEIRALDAAVAAAKNQLEYATLVAPFDGEVAARFVDNFQTVQAKQPIIRLLDVSRIEVTVQIPESLIGIVPQVKKVACRFDAIAGQEFYGTVTKIGREASQTTRTYPVTVEIEQPDGAKILPGMAATVRNHVEEGEPLASADLVVPLSAVFTTAEGSQTYVWVFDEANKSVERRAVKTGDLTPVGQRISEGLKAGEFVVTSGVNTLREGQEVKLL
ncbi:efflux RND transporter periplasmic adaptor subunit [Stieleria sp. TO1_6]|uniref:efflux RND transporter periplasmic adaptor subunit n=1 Tax=Stieleria tagensis TaxID=2956795 RepID=UPI00209B817F|nr:efflux RND transporter periplasmic adaptor subunit [Stieleria tagensis]MCO8123115.1 efflux RND transporter periplasmic adaptor subunit [Stieleria tagensis]